MKSIDLTNEYLALGCNRGKIFVFSMKTNELVRGTSIFDHFHNIIRIVVNAKASQTYRRSSLIKL